jgi:hypothetical protein
MSSLKQIEANRRNALKDWVGFPRLSHELRLLAGPCFEVADISLCSGLQVCSPPRSSLPLRILPQGSRGFYIRAYRALLPPHAPDMLTVRIQAIDGTGTCTLLDSQPCRLLTWLHGHYSASSLIQTHPPPSRRRPISRLSRLYDLPCSGDFSPGRGGLLQLLGMSLSPCCRYHPAEIKAPHRSDFGTPCCLRPCVGGSALGFTHFRGHFAFTLITAR